MSKLSVFDLDQTGGRDPGSVQERRVLKGSRLLDADVKIEARVGNLSTGWPVSKPPCVKHFPSEDIRNRGGRSTHKNPGILPY